MKKIFTILLLTGSYALSAQDTFSIIAIDPITKEVGSAGASCIDLTGDEYADLPLDFLSQHIPEKGGIITQAAYYDVNQYYASQAMMQDFSPEEIIDWLINNDAENTPEIRQYGIVDLYENTVRVKAFTGEEAFDYKGHIEGPTYTVQGNILLGKEVLESMQTGFEKQEGSLACKLMTSLQGANIVGADSRCMNNGTSSLFAFLKVSKLTDQIDSPSLLLGVKTGEFEGREPIDLLQKKFDDLNISCPALDTKDLKTNNSVVIYPNPADQFISINTEIKFDEIELFSIDGKLIKKIQVKNQTDKIKVNDFKPGIYLIKIYKDKNLVKSSKFIKK